MPQPSQDREQANLLSRQIIGAAIEVHRHLGPGLLESAYQVCMEREFQVRNIPFARQVDHPLSYKGRELDCAYRLDLLVGGLVVVELKAVEELAPVHEAQLLTYLRLTGCWLGLLINFNVIVLKDGIRRLVNG
jgi:GxxExxY protein